MQRALVIERVFWFNTSPQFCQWMPLPLPAVFETYFPIDLTPDLFTTGPSDWDVPSDEIYCPCGKKLPWPSRTVGEAMRLVRAEMREHGK